MQNKHIYIIGAGISGLAAANELKKSGCQVTLLEARNRVGGRIKTDNSLGVSFPCGAAYIHGIEENPLYPLLQECRAELVYSDNLPIRVFNDAKSVIAEVQLNNAKVQFRKILQATKKFIPENCHDIFLLEAIKNVLKVKADILKSDELRWELIYLSFFTGVEASYLSAKYWDQCKEFNGGNYLVLSTYDALIQKLAHNQTIHLNTVVDKIYYDDNKVLIKTNKGNFDADAVIVTVPLGVLQSERIEFYPPLPAEKKTAVSHLKMSLINKIGLMFPEQFWPNDIIKIGYIKDPSTNVPIFINYCNFYKKPFLLGGVYGDTAIELEKMGGAAFVERAMTTLRDLFGNDIPNPVGSITTNWLSDPYSLGSYSHIPVGASGDDFDVLAEPVNNRLFFAGEATHRTYHSTAHGAYLSGIREAKRISDLYK